MRRLYEIQQDKDHMANQSNTLESLRAEVNRACQRPHAADFDAERLLKALLVALEAEEQNTIAEKKLADVAYRAMLDEEEQRLKIKAHVVALRKALKKYGEHKYVRCYRGPCDCGLDRVLEETKP
jgi:uncharacterized protein YicC (UPF0701 family)